MFMWEIKEEGREEGRAEGRAEGLQEGRTEGQALALSNVKKIKNLFKENTPVEEIAEITELGIEQVQEIIEDILSPV